MTVKNYTIITWY